MYACVECGKEIKKIEHKFVRCPYCGSRRLAKIRPPVAREVSTD
jgi:DNA-directed RNA polymerase subunit RPC12/RpoP